MAELRKGIKWLLFLSSYIPLYTILTIKHWDITITVPENQYLVLNILSGMKLPLVSVLWVILSVLSGFALWLVLSLRRSKGGQDFTQVSSFRSRNDLITSYILVYVFPFVVLDYTVLTNWIAFLIFFAVIGVIQVRSNHLYVNPVLALFSYDIYEVDTGDKRLTVLTKDNLGNDSGPIKTVELSNDVYMSV